MACENPTTSRLFNSPRIDKKSILVFDARVHRVYPANAGGEIAILLRDQDQFVTGLVTPGIASEETIGAASHLTQESLLHVSGTLLLDREGQVHGTCSMPTVLQIHISSLSIISKAREGIPMSRVSHGGPDEISHISDVGISSLSERLDNRIMDLRIAANAAIVKLFSGAYHLSVRYLEAEGFHWTPTPTLIGYKIPGDDDYFEVPYFDGQKAWLTQTGEVHIGMALAADLGRVYDIHTVFRRERNVSSRHLTEFTLIEVGFALKHGWPEVLARTEQMIIFVLRSLQEQETYKRLLEQASRIYPLAGAFKLGLDENGHLLQITFQDAKRILRELGSTASEMDDFSREEEALLGAYVASPETCLGPSSDVFVITQYPRHVRPYSFFPSEEDPNNISNSFDVIIRGQECTTGLQLLHSYEDLRAAMTARDPPIDPDSPMWRTFTAAHEAGMPPCGGFGVGLNRLVQGFIGLSDVHETVPFPRDASRLLP